MKLSDDALLALKVMRWALAEGWTVKRRTVSFDGWDVTTTWTNGVGQDVEIRRFQDDAVILWMDSVVGVGSVVQAVDALVMFDHLPPMFSSAWAAGRESAYITDGEIDFVTWDHREHPYCDDIDQAVSKLSGGRIRVTNVDDTGSDQHALAFGCRKLEQDEATEVYLAWLRRRWEEDDNA